MDNRQEYNLELIRALDQLITEGKWEGSLFFQAMGKKLTELSRQLKEELGLSETEHAKLTAPDIKNLVKQRSGLVEIYVALYNAEGRNLKKWESILNNLSRQLVTRPIYKKEKDIQNAIATKENTINDAYAIAYINELDVLTASFRDKKPIDRFGHELMIIKENSLLPENITKFIHLDKTYHYHKGILSIAETS